MATQLKPTFAQLVFQKRDELANHLANQQALNPRLSWIYEAQMAKLPSTLQNDEKLKEQMLAELAEQGASLDYLETLRRAYEAGSEEAKTIALGIAKLMDAFYTNVAQASLQNQIDPIALSQTPIFRTEMTELAQGLEAYNQLVNQNLKIFDKNENEEITYENKQQLNQNAPDPNIQSLQNRAENRSAQEFQFNPKPEFRHVGKDLLAVAAIEKIAVAEKVAKMLAEKAAEVGMQLSRRA